MEEVRSQVTNQVVEALDKGKTFAKQVNAETPVLKWYLALSLGLTGVWVFSGLTATLAGITGFVAGYRLNK